MHVPESIAVLGSGKMGEALIAGLIESNVVSRSRLIAADSRRERLEWLKRRYRIRTEPSNPKAVAKARVVILAVKPLVIPIVLDEIRDVVGEKHVIISIAAGVGTCAIEKALGKPAPVVRAMPNTPCLIRDGMTVLSAGRHAKSRDLEMARTLFSALGRCLILDEKYLDAVTAVSGSGPAYQFVILDALADGGVKAGLTREVAVELAAQTMRGAASMVLLTGEHPGKLKDAVATPGGCTVEGLMELEEGGLRATLIRAVVRAARRAAELGADKS
jgi:pyrroline-5-carboxylate reductase